MGKAILQELHETSYEIRALIMPQDHATDDSHVHYYKGDVLEPDSLLPFLRTYKIKKCIYCMLQGLLIFKEKYPLNFMM